MARKEYMNLTLTETVLEKYLEKRRKKEHRQSLGETAQAILIDVLEIPENELRDGKKSGKNKK